MTPPTPAPRGRRSAGIRLLRPEEISEQVRTTFDAIARRAFEIFQGNGGHSGNALDDWFRAEAELFHPTPVELAESDNVLTLKAGVPGFTEKDLRISIEPGRVTITGKRAVNSTRVNEIFRIIDLPKRVDPESHGIAATCNKGMLTITLPEV